MERVAAPPRSPLNGSPYRRRPVLVLAAGVLTVALVVGVLVFLRRSDGGGDPSAGPRPAVTGFWQPAPRTSWQWQLAGAVDQSFNVRVYDIDGFENSATVVAALHAKGRKVICYLNVGAAETFRPDYAAFPAAVLGKGNGWDGERWLDIRQTSILLPIMAKRFDLCRTKGFDAVEPDNVDAYANDSGFPLTAADQLRYNRAIARLAHDRGLSVGLKNDLDQIPQLVGDFQFAVDEQCAEFSECDELVPFVQQRKAVFHVEYTLKTSAFCPQTSALGFSSLRKNPHLDAHREAC